jgi:hypothetical protein
MRFTLTVNSRAEYDSNEYFTTERSFNTNHLIDALEHIEAFLKSVGFEFEQLEAVVEDDEDLDEEIVDAEDYNSNYINRK